MGQVDVLEVATAVPQNLANDTIPFAVARSCCQDVECRDLRVSLLFGEHSPLAVVQAELATGPSPPGISMQMLLPFNSIFDNFVCEPV